MPFRYNAARRHHIRRARYRVTNWPTYEVGLRRRGDLTVWVDETALAGWQAPRRSTPGGQPRYSELAIGLVLTLRLVFHLALRQAEGFARSVLQLFGMALPVPDHTTLSRRSHVQLMAKRGRIGWQRATGYGKRNYVETTMGRYKHLIGPKLHARSQSAQHGEVAFAVQVLNHMICEAKPVSVRR